MRWKSSSGRRSRLQGYVLVTTALTIVALIGILGLCVDLSRMYVVRNELQAYADAASLAAARHLDGTSAGLTYATNVAKSYPDKWNFATTAPETVAVSFASDPSGPYVANPASPVGIKYVQVTATGTVTLYFLPSFSTLAPSAMLLGIARQEPLTVTATSGQFLKSTPFSTGLLPYSPYAHDPNDPNFGFTPGQQYTLRWPPPGQENKNNACPGDANFPDPSTSSSQRGFIDIGWPAGIGPNGGGSAFIREAIISNVQSHPLNIGDTLTMVMGNRGTESDALRERFSEDTDTTSTTWADYSASLQAGTANGRRLGIVPVNDPNNNDVVLGFALVLLQSDICGPSNVSPCCATYISSSPVIPGIQGGSSTPGAFQLKLYK